MRWLRIRKAPRSRHEGHDAADKIPVTVSETLLGMVYYCCFGWSANLIESMGWRSNRRNERGLK